MGDSRGTFSSVSTVNRRHGETVLTLRTEVLEKKEAGRDVGIAGAAGGLGGGGGGWGLQILNKATGEGFRPSGICTDLKDIRAV